MSAEPDLPAGERVGSGVRPWRARTARQLLYVSARCTSHDVTVHGSTKTSSKPLVGGWGRKSGASQDVHILAVGISKSDYLRQMGASIYLVTHPSAVPRWLAVTGGALCFAGAAVSRSRLMSRPEP
jgi:hypothetical protein